MKKTLTLLAAVVFLMHAQAQITWLKKGGNLNGEAANDASSYSTSISADGNTVAIGGYLNDGNGAEAGHVRVYNWNGSAWAQKGTDIDGEAAGDQLGLSVSISADGNTLVAGAYYNDGGGTNSGHARVYGWNGTAWIQKGADINGEAANDYAGWSVAISASGNDVIVGSWGNDSQANSFTGQVEIYTWSGSAWVQKGSDIEGETGSGHFGFSVSMSADGNTIAAGARYNDGAAGVSTSAGHARVYSWNGTAWVQKGGDLDGVVAVGYFGWSVDLSGDGNTVIAGAPGDVGMGYGGNAYVYSWNGTAWAMKGAAITNEGTNDLCGFSVSTNADGSVIAVGGRQNSGNYTASGNARMYSWNGSAWVQMGIDIDGDWALDKLGTSVALSADGNTVIVGAPGSDSTTVDAGQAKVYRVCVHSTGTAVITACNSYTWIDGNTYTTSNNAATHTLTNVSGCDSVVTLNLTINNSTAGTNAVSSCSPYIWIDGNTYTADNNSATHTLVNANGCDSVVTLNLTINPQPDVTVSQTGNVLTVADTTATFYQWGNCTTQTPIDSANSISYTPTVTGTYAVFVMNTQGCADTSDCLAVTVTVGIESIDETLIHISPNPFTDKITIDFTIHSTGNETVVEIYDAVGKLIKREKISFTQHVIQLSECSSGYYLLQVLDGGKIYRQNMLKQ